MEYEDPMPSHVPLEHLALLGLIVETARVGTSAPGTSVRHKKLLEGIHNLADILLQDYRMSESLETSHAIANLRAVCETAREGLIDPARTLEDAFHHILDAAERIFVEPPA